MLLMSHSTRWALLLLVQELWTNLTSASPPVVMLHQQMNRSSAVEGEDIGGEGDWSSLLVVTYIEDENNCFHDPMDDSWYTHQAFYLNKVAICDFDDAHHWREELEESLEAGGYNYGYEDEDDMDEDEEDEDDDDEVDGAPHFVDPKDDKQIHMAPEESEKYWTIKEQPHFLVPKHIPPGKVESILWRDTMKEVNDTEIFAVGLPPEVLQEFRSYFEANGIVDIIDELLYGEDNAYASDHYESEMMRWEQKQMEQGSVWTLKDGHKWSVKRADHWDTDMVWFDPIDEACYESIRSVLRRSNFDVVLQGIQERLNYTKLVVHGAGAIFASHFDGDGVDYSFLHRDIPDTRGAFYNILVPIYLPDDDEDDDDGDDLSKASLYIGGTDGLCAPIRLMHNVATVVGSDSFHGTGECDFRPKRKFRLSMSIWVSEITEDILDILSSDGLSHWPIDGDRDWYLAHQNRTLNPDPGRDRLEIHDYRHDCHRLEEYCDTHIEGVRNLCPKTCKAYMTSEEYYPYLEALKLEEAKENTK